MIAVFGPDGGLIAQNDDGIDIDPLAPVAPDLNGKAWDVLLTLDLAPGTYTVSVMQFLNVANGPNLSDGFFREGQDNYTSSYPCDTAQASFRDSFESDYCARTNLWALDILNVEEAALNGTPVPEPESMALLLFGALAAIGLRRRRASR